MSGNDTGNPPPDVKPGPANAFALVGNEIRVEIIQVLGADPDGDELRFTELRSRLDTDVAPSQLHYHLQQLVGHFVENTDSGYTLHPAGSRLCLSLHAGTFNRRQEQLSVETDVNCYYCQARVEARFENGFVRIECPNCEYYYGGHLLDFPLEAFEKTSAAFSYFKEYMTLKTLSMARGVCPSCTHPLNPEFQSHEECSCRHKVYIDQFCDRCGATWKLKVGQALLVDSQLIAFCHEHGVDILSTPYWELEFAATDKYVTVRSTDHWEVALEMTFDDDTLELVVDEDLNVIERHRRGSAITGRTLSGSTTGGAGATSIKSAQGDTVGAPDITACLESLRHHRWPDGVTCPYCDSTDTIKEGTTGKDTQRYRCHSCNRIFNDLTGTIFSAHRFPLPEMFHIINEMEDKTPKQIARYLNRSYDSVLDFVHEIEDRSHEESGLDLFEVCQMTLSQ